MTEEKAEAAYWLAQARGRDMFPETRASYALVSIAASLVWLAKKREAEDA